MRILIIDRNPPLDDNALRMLYLRGYDIVLAAAEANAAESVRDYDPDCILVAVPGLGAADFAEVSEIRHLARTCAVALLTSTSTDSFIEEALAEGTIERTSAQELMGKVGGLVQPAFIVASRFDASSIEAIRELGLQLSVASTLQFAMNLLVDGWCQIILLEVEIPGLTDDGRLAIFHQVHAKHLAILASAQSGTSSAIVHSRKPTRIGEFIRLFEQIAGNRPSPCGRTEQLRNS